MLWYAAPPVTSFADYTGTPGMVMSLFGAALALAAALQVGHYSFMGQPQVPRKLETGGMYALLRHPQALGNMLFLIGGWLDWLDWLDWLAGWLAGWVGGWVEEGAPQSGDGGDGGGG